MAANTTTLSTNWPRSVRRALEVMADADLRQPDNFLAWLIMAEARRRGLVLDPAAMPLEPTTPPTVND